MGVLSEGTYWVFGAKSIKWNNCREGDRVLGRPFGVTTWMLAERSPERGWPTTCMLPSAGASFMSYSSTTHHACLWSWRATSPNANLLRKLLGLSSAGKSSLVTGFRAGVLDLRVWLSWCAPYSTNSMKSSAAGFLTTSSSRTCWRSLKMRCSMGLALGSACLRRSFSWAFMHQNSQIFT